MSYQENLEKNLKGWTGKCLRCGTDVTDLLREDGKHWYYCKKCWIPNEDFFPTCESRAKEECYTYAFD